MSRSKFTINDGLVLQFNALAVWKKKLSTKCYKALEAECFEQNKLLDQEDSGYKVFRGQSLTTFIENWKP